MTAVSGTALLLGQDLRRDRIVVPAWVAALVLMTYASASATDTLFASSADRVRVATSLNEQPGLLGLYGPILDPSSRGELAMSKLTVLYALLSCVLYVVLVRRHTRVEEESGRAELAGGTAVGRDAPMAAAVLEGGAVALLVGVLVALAAVAGGLPLAGASWFGASWTGTGLVATGVAVVSCQVSASARTCGSVAAGLLGGAFVVRGVGDAVEAVRWLSWGSPLGWNTQLQAWSGPRPWVAGLYVVLAAALVALARLLRSHRDLGAGVVSARPGPTSGRLRGPWGLALRLHRTSLLVWTVGAAGLGVLFGAMIPGFDDLLGTSGGRELVDRLGGTFIAALLPVVAGVVTCFPVAVVSSAHHDEETGRAALVLGSASSRSRWFAATAAVAAAGAGWLLLVTGVALAVGYGAAGGVEAGEAVPAALGWTPAVWVVTAGALAGLACRQGWVGWAFLLLALLLAIAGELLGLPGWVVASSPYAAVSTYPAGDWDWTPVVLLGVLSALLGAAAWWILARRDVA